MTTTAYQPVRHLDVGAAHRNRQRGYLLDRSNGPRISLARRPRPKDWCSPRALGGDPLLRDFYFEHGVQAQVRLMIRHFTDLWGPSAARTIICTRCSGGGPQKQATGWRIAAHQGEH